MELVCKSSESDLIKKKLIEEIENFGLSKEVFVATTGCFGFYEKGPIVKITPDDVFYVHVTPKDAKEIVENHLVNSEIIERLLYEEPTINKKVKTQDEMIFIKSK